MKEGFFDCAGCDKIQASGLSEETAEYFGWRLIKGKCYCPFCTGNTGNLKKTFGVEAVDGTSDDADCEF
jgi:hypothetical protein